MSGPTCSMCGRVADAETEGDPPLGWSSDHDPVAGAGAGSAAPRLICPGCTRRYVRSIEAKLDHDWW